jgi:hypothetical protein
MLMWTAASIPAIVYIAGYFTLSDGIHHPDSTSRTFSSTATAFAYAPLGWVEAKFSRRRVLLVMPGRSEFGGRMICIEP